MILGGGSQSENGWVESQSMLGGRSLSDIGGSRVKAMFRTNHCSSTMYIYQGISLHSRISTV